MLKLKKIINTIVIFIVSMLIICFIFSLFKVVTKEINISDIVNETGLYFLYTIGYGALEGDSVIQNILAMVGIVSLALMTTYLTINLFWRLDDVKLNKEIQYDDNSLTFQFRNEGRTICDMKVTFVLYNKLTFENIEVPKEYYMPILLNNSKWKLKVNLNETFWYRTVYNLLTSSNKKLYCVFSFVDTRTGQGSIKVEELTKENIKITEGLLNYQEFIKPSILPCKKLMPIENNANIKIEESEYGIRVKYEFTEKSDDNSFVMAYYNLHEPFLNLEKYNKETTYLEIDLNSENNIRLNFEIKLANNIIITKYIEINKESKTIQIQLRETSNNLEEIKEICYTIFQKENNSRGMLDISDLRIVTK